MKKATFIIFLLLAFSILFFAACGEEKLPPPTVDDLLTFFENEGLEVALPEPGSRGTKFPGIDLAREKVMGSGDKEVTLRTVQVDGVVTLVHCFASDMEARKYFSVTGGRFPLPRINLDVVVTPKLVYHKNFVLLMFQGLQNQDDATNVARIEETFKRFE